MENYRPAARLPGHSRSSRACSAFIRGGTGCRRESRTAPDLHVPLSKAESVLHPLSHGSPGSVTTPSGDLERLVPVRICVDEQQKPGLSSKPISGRFRPAHWKPGSAPGGHDTESVNRGHSWEPAPREVGKLETSELRGGLHGDPQGRLAPTAAHCEVPPTGARKPLSQRRHVNPPPDAWGGIPALEGDVGAAVGATEPSLPPLSKAGAPHRGRWVMLPCDPILIGALIAII